MTTHTGTFIGSADAADLLGLDRFAFLRLVKRGAIVPVFQGPGKRGAMFFSRADVERLARERAA